MTSGGLLVSERALAADVRLPGALGALPPLKPFVEPLPILPVLPERRASELVPAPTNSPNRATNPATNLPFEGRSEPHQSRDRFPPRAFFMTRMGANPNVSVHPDLPPQTFWGFNRGGADFSTDPPMSPGPVQVTHYGSPALVRRYNALPPPEQNGGFGVPEVSTHPAQLPFRPRQRRRTVRPGAAAILLPRPVLRLLLQHAVRGVELGEPA